MSNTRKPEDITLKQRFIDAIKKGELGNLDERGVIVTLKELRQYFPDIKTQYITSFLPAATLRPGQTTISHTRFVFRLRKGVYLVHPDALK